MRSKRTGIGVIALIALTVAVAAEAMSASAAKHDFDFPFDLPRAALVGTWDVTLTLPGPSGPTTARVLATFDGHGGTVESAAAPGTVRGASHGAWERIDRRLFAVTRIFFRFEGGVYVGTTKVNATVRVAPGGETFTAVSVSELRDPAGNLIRGGLRGTAAGTRVHVERIPDQPS